MNNIIIKDNKEYRRLFIDNNPTNYFISEVGDVYNIMTNNILTSSIDSNGRKYVCISISGKSIPMRVHKLVAITFIGEIPKDMTINHIDENYLNNDYRNLEIVSASENTKKYLENNGNIHQKYPDELIHNICKELKSGIYYRNLCDKYNMPVSYLFNLVHARVRKNIVKDYVPFPISSYRVKNNRNDDKFNITKLVKLNYTNSEIYSALNLESNNANIKLINKIRKKLDIQNPSFIAEDLKNNISELIKSGYTNAEISSKLKIKYDKQMKDLFARLRKKLGIPDFNRTGVPIKIQKEMMELIKQGKSNNFLLEKYNLERNKYTTNLFGKLRQNVKKQSSTTIESNDMYNIYINL